MINELVYEGKVKWFFKIEEVGVLCVVYKDDVIVLNGVWKEFFVGKGEFNN